MIREDKMIEFWGNHVLQLLATGRVLEAQRFVNENGSLLTSWEHGFCNKLFSIPTDTLKDVFLLIAAHCPVDEMVFDLVEVSNDLDNTNFFAIVLPAYLILLSRDPNQKYLDWYMGMTKTRLIMLSSMDVESQQYVKTSFDNIEAAAKIFHPLTQKIRCLLIAELLSYSVMGQEHMNNHALRILNNLLPDPFFLLPYIEAGLNTSAKKYNPILDSSIVSMRAVCLYFSTRVRNCDFPLIYSPKYLLTSCLPILHQMMDSDELSLEIFAHFSRYEVRFSVNDLTPHFTKCVSALNNVMIYNQTQEQRDTAFRVFNFLMSSLDSKGLYQMLLNYRNQVNHPSTISYLMSQIKKSFMDPNNEYFKGLCSGQRRRFSNATANDKTGEDDEYEDNIRNRILQASLPLVKEYGWSQQTIAEGAKVLGYPGVTSGMFQSGAADLIFYFYEDCNKKLVSQMETDATLAKEKQEPREIVEAAIQTRLRMIIPYLDKWPQALGIMTLPRNVPIALSNLLTLVDDICFHAGDRSVDFNWYSRRLAVGGIYKMTELCLIQDKSDDFSVTWEFLHRRMDEAMNVHSLLQSSGDVTNVARDAVLATFTTARNILRLNQTR